MAIFFTSDLHFGHENILTHCNRPFDNVTEMNEMLIRNWNRKVGNEDEVYIIGDLAFRSGRPVKEYLDRLNGRKHFIIGNHDLWLKNFPSASEYFLSVDHMRVIEMNSMRITLCHYPLFEWSGSRRALQQDKSKSWLIHGHLHNRTEADAFRYIKAKLPCALNAGVDINHFEPVTFSELISNNNAWYGRDPCLTDINQGQTNPKEIGNNLKKIRKEIQRREQKLANNAFLTHAPVHIVDGEREKLEKARSYEKCLEKELDVLQSSSDKHYL